MLDDYETLVVNSLIDSKSESTILELIKNENKIIFNLEINQMFHKIYASLDDRKIISVSIFHLICKYGNERLIRRSISKGGDINNENFYGVAPSDIILERFPELIDSRIMLGLNFERPQNQKYLEIKPTEESNSKIFWLE